MEWKEEKRKRRKRRKQREREEERMGRESASQCSFRLKRRRLETHFTGKRVFGLFSLPSSSHFSLLSLPLSLFPLSLSLPLSSFSPSLFFLSLSLLSFSLLSLSLFFLSLIMMMFMFFVKFKCYYCPGQKHKIELVVLFTFFSSFSVNQYLSDGMVSHSEEDLSRRRKKKRKEGGEERRRGKKGEKKEGEENSQKVVRLNVFSSMKFLEENFHSLTGIGPSTNFLPGQEEDSREREWVREWERKWVREKEDQEKIVKVKSVGFKKLRSSSFLFSCSHSSFILSLPFSSFFISLSLSRWRKGRLCWVQD